MNPIVRVGMHLRVAECHVTYIGHFDFNFDLWFQFCDNLVQSISPK